MARPSSPQLEDREGEGRLATAGESTVACCVLLTDTEKLMPPFAEGQCAMSKRGV